MIYTGNLNSHPPVTKYLSPHPFVSLKTKKEDCFEVKPLSMLVTQRDLLHFKREKLEILRSGSLNVSEVREFSWSPLTPDTECGH